MIAIITLRQLNACVEATARIAIFTLRQLDTCAEATYWTHALRPLQHGACQGPHSGPAHGLGFRLPKSVCNWVACQGPHSGPAHGLGFRLPSLVNLVSCVCRKRVQLGGLPKAS
eukprot:1159068-Pelagomonas_calceolata.AAC.4